MLHAQRDFLLVAIDVQDHHLDDVALLDQFLRVVDPPGPRHFADVDQPLDPGFQLDKCPVGHDVHDLARVLAAHRILGLDVLPRAGRLVLERKRDLFLLFVDVEDVDLEFLIDLDHVARVLHAVPGHVRNVQQAVDAAQIDEGAELGDVLDDALANLARFDCREQFTLQPRAIFLQQFPSGDDDIPPHLVDLEDHALNFFVDVIADVRWPANIDLAGGQEDVDADVDQQPALDLPRDEALDAVAFLVLGQNPFPFFLPLGLAIGESDDAVLVFHRLKQDLNRVADLRDKPAARRLPLSIRRS